MKRKYVILIICVFFVLCTGMVGSKSGSAWLNGKNDHAQTLIKYKNDYFPTHFYTTTSDHYSTHDWIAECALDLIVTKYPEHKFIQMMHLNIRDMKIYFLLGTEVPDSLRISGEKKFQTVRTSMRTIERKDIPYVYDHHLVFDPITGKLEESDITLSIAKCARQCQQKAEQMLGLGDCQAAAFYLGVMCHYIADAVFFPHITETGGTLNPTQSTDATLKWRMHYLTSRKLSDWMYCNGEPTALFPFFTYTDAKAYFIETNTAKYKNAWQATWWAGHHVCFGRAIAGMDNLPIAERPYRPSYIVDDAWVMNDYHESTGNAFPPGFDLETLKKEERRYDYWNQIPLDSWERDYLTALQHHLELGVYYCAGVINHIKDSYTKCESGIEKSLTQTIEQLAVEYAFLWMMAGLGQFALFVVLAQTAASSFSEDKLSILKALQIHR